MRKVCVCAAGWGSPAAGRAARSRPGSLPAGRASSPGGRRLPLPLVVSLKPGPPPRSDPARAAAPGAVRRAGASSPLRAKTRRRRRRRGAGCGAGGQGQVPRGGARSPRALLRPLGAAVPWPGAFEGKAGGATSCSGVTSGGKGTRAPRGPHPPDPSPRPARPLCVLGGAGAAWAFAPPGPRLPEPRAPFLGRARGGGPGPVSAERPVGSAVGPAPGAPAAPLGAGVGSGAHFGRDEPLVSFN